MKKIVLFLILFVSFVIPQRTQAQKGNWVTLESDTSAINAPGQLMTVMLNGSLNAPISNAALTLRYDPACFRVTSHHPGNLLRGATSAITAQPGQFDLTYRFQDKHQSNIGEGSLMNIQLQALKACTSNLTVSSNSVLLQVLDAQGSPVNLPNVEYHTLSIHLTESLIPAATTAAHRIAPASNFSLPPVINDNVIFLLTLAMLPIGGVLAYVMLLRRRANMPTKYIPAPGEMQLPKIPALIQPGHTIPLSQPRTRLGRHTEIVQRGTGFYLADTSGAPGTLLNGKHIGRGCYFLHDGDQVQVSGESAYRFVRPNERTA